MAYTKTTWKDRVVEFANRFAKSGETSTEVTLTASPGTVTEAGTPLSATNLNKIETQYDEAIAEADKRIQSLARNAFSAYAPIDRYPATSQSIFFMEGAGLPSGITYGHALTLRTWTDRVYDRQMLYQSDGAVTGKNGIWTRDPLASSKPAWATSTAYALNDLRMPTSAKENGIYYKCTTAGTSGATEPVWPTTIGATVADGTAVWTAEAKFWSDWVQLLDSSDTTRVKKSGDTMTGALTVDDLVTASGRLVVKNGPVDSNGGVEVGRTDGTTGTPYIDFHTGANVDYDARIIASGSATATGTGTGSINVIAGNVTINANKVWHAGSDGAGSGLDADTVDGKHASDFSTLKIATGTYTGDGTIPRTINLGFTPKYLFIKNNDSGSVGWTGLGGALRFQKDWGLFADETFGRGFEITTNGVIVGYQNNGETQDDYDTNVSTRVYNYFAIY
jgi:hypothetical protein